MQQLEAPPAPRSTPRRRGQRCPASTPPKPWPGHPFPVPAGGRVPDWGVMPLCATGTGNAVPALRPPALRLRAPPWLRRLPSALPCLHKSRGPGWPREFACGLVCFSTPASLSRPVAVMTSPRLLKGGIRRPLQTFSPSSSLLCPAEAAGRRRGSGRSPSSHPAPFAGVAPRQGSPPPPREPSASPATLPALPQALCAAVTTSDLAETQALLFCGAAVTCATGDPQCPTPLALAEKSGQRLQMEFLLHNKNSGKG